MLPSEKVAAIFLQWRKQFPNATDDRLDTWYDLVYAFADEFTHADTDFDNDKFLLAAGAVTKLGD